LKHKARGNFSGGNIINLGGDKMVKRFFSTLLVVVLLASVIAGCGNSTDQNSNSSSNGTVPATTVDTKSTDGSDSNVNLDGTLPIIKDPAKQEKMKMAIVVPPDRTVASGELAMIKKLAEDTGVVFDWQNIPADGATEKINLMLSSGTLPDAFWNGISTDMAVQYSDQDVFIPTEDLINKYMPRLKDVFAKRPDYKAGSTAPNGHSYGFPYIEEMHGLVQTPGPFLINTEWLKKVGKQMPTTVDEYVDCLKAFRDAKDLNGNGKNDEIPLSMGMTSQDAFGCYNVFYQFTGCFGQADSYCALNPNADHLRIIDGKVVFTAADDAFKRTANFFNMLYKEKLIDADSFSPGPIKDQPLFLNKIQGDEAVIGSFCIWAPANQIPNVDVRKQYAALPRLTGDSGKMGFKLNFSQMQDTSMVTITTACKHPEIIAAYVDYCFDPEISVTLNWGSEGIIYKKGSDGILHFDLDSSNNIVLKNGWKTFGEMRDNSTPARGSMAVLDEYYGTVADYTWDAQDLLAGQMTNGKEEVLKEYTSIPKMMLKVEEQTKLSQIAPQIGDIVRNYTTQWVLDGNADATWDEYKSQLDAAGLQDLIKIYQTAYDRFTAK
jgi:putative aldouronate transport system substrate-binding protein